MPSKSPGPLIFMSSSARSKPFSVAHMRFRSQTGANIIKISRGTKEIVVPSAEQELFPGDRILVVGTKEQLDRFQALTEASAEKEEGQRRSFRIEAVTLNMESFLTGKTLRGASFSRISPSH